MIKVVIFDFDDTIYIGENWDKWLDYIKDAFMHFVKDKKEYEKIVAKYNINKKMNTKDIIKIPRQIGIETNDMLKYLDEHMYHHESEKLKVLPNEFFKELRQKHSLYIVSMSLQSYLIFYLKKFNIDSENFKQVLNMDFIKSESTKGHTYLDIANLENVEPADVLVVGDSYKNDVLPAIELGMQSLHFNGDFNKIYDYLEKNQIMNCYKFRK